MISSYNFSDITNDEAGSLLEPFCTDAEFGRDIHEIARSFNGEKAFYYHMRYGNPFPGPFHDLAHHAVDLLFLFQTYSHLLSEKLAKAAEQMGNHWISFINGGDPWPAYSEEGTAMCYGPDQVTASSRHEDEMCRYERWEKFGGGDEWSKCSMIIRGESAAPK